MSSVFRFKEFEVDQQGCAMKINTDGVLLGALSQGNDISSVLDIGTGTGVIALMMAQKYVNAKIYAVEIDQSACQAAIKNFANSKFHDRLEGVYGTFEDVENPESFDLIISNPPFYTNSLHNPDIRKKLARHADYDFFDRLLLYAFKKLSPSGSLSLILPSDLAVYVRKQALDLGLFVQQTIDIKSFDNSEVFRKIYTFTREQTQEQIDEFIIYKERGVYSDQYKELLKPFFLAF